MIRMALPGDASAFAAIKNAWIDETPWMVRVHAAEDVQRHYADVVLPRGEVLVAGTTGVDGYLVLDGEVVTSLFVASAARGKGIGAALLGQAKVVRRWLELWTFRVNEGARRFYKREGFAEAGRSHGENEERLPDVLLRWERAQ